MTIKHLVISGGGPIGMAYLGALEYLHDEGFWKLDEIESIYATSIGTIGVIHPEVLENYHLKYPVTCFEARMNDLFEIFKANS